jgi:glycosyltransferase involved in cell wall biosynthesis
MEQKKVKVLSNFKAMGRLLEGNPDCEHELLNTQQGVGDCLRLAWKARSSIDFLILNIDQRRLLLTCALYWLVAPRPFRRCKIVSVDLLLRPAKTPKARIVGFCKRILLKQVDAFLLYFKNIAGYHEQFGIPPKRTLYVPFKVNSWEKLNASRGKVGDGEYVLLAGATLRDHATFVEAIRRTKIPAKLLIPEEDRWLVQETAWYKTAPPPSLEIEFHADGKEETYLSYFYRARILCLPRFKWDIASTGISAYLCAMALGKCVVISRGPGAEDVLSESQSAVFCRPEDPSDLARALMEVWENKAECERVAQNGVRYAESLKGEDKLMSNILRALQIPHKDV